MALWSLEYNFPIYPKTCNLIHGKLAHSLPVKGASTRKLHTVGPDPVITTPKQARQFFPI